FQSEVASFACRNGNHVAEAGGDSVDFAPGDDSSVRSQYDVVIAPGGDGEHVRCGGGHIGLIKKIVTPRDDPSISLESKAVIHAPSDGEGIGQVRRHDAEL